MHKFLWAGFIFTLLSLAWKAYGSPYSEDDINRLLYIRKPAGSSLASHFLVLKRVGLDRRTLHCRIYGTNHDHQVDIANAVKLPFYEESSIFMITQYAIYNFAVEKSSNPALLLAQLSRDGAARVAPIIRFQQEKDRLRKEFFTILANAEFDQDDRDDTIADLLEKSPLFTLPNSAVANGDLLTAAALCENLANFIKSGLMRRVLTSDALRDTANELFNKCVKDLLSDLSVKISTPNARQEIFRKHFPRARSIWSESPPGDYKNLRRIFYASMESYFKLDNISQLVAPQDWGSAMLDVLLLTEGCPTASRFEQEFDMQSRKWSQRHAADKSGI